MTRKLVSIFCVLLALSLALTACSGTTTQPQSNTSSQAPAQASSQSKESTPQSQEAAVRGKTVAEVLNMTWDQIAEQAKEEGEVVYATWGDEAEWNRLAARFTEKYGVKFTIVTGEKVNMMNKAIAELNGTGTIDVMMLAGETVNGLLGAGALAPNVLPKIEDKDKLVPGLSQRKEGVSNSEGWWMPININPAGFLYNANNISNPPQTWEEFEAYIDANPKKFGFCIPEKGGTGQAMMEALIANLTGGLEQYLLDPEVDPEKHAKWDVVWDWLNSRKDKITFVNSNNDAITRLNGGELDLVVAWNSTVDKAVRNGELFKHYGYYVPEFGLCYSGDTIAALKNAPHPAAALLWMNWLASEEAQTLAADILAYFPSRTDLQVDVSRLAEGEQAKNVDWMSACYKTQYISDFTRNVLQ